MLQDNLDRNKLLGKLARNPLTYIVIASPFLLYAIILLLPTFDDWTYYTNPYHDFGDSFINRLLPDYSYWRPWDALFGYILSLAPALFPTLNHVVVYLAHLVSTFIIYRLAANFGFNTLGRNIATIFFFASPAMLGTVLGIDSLNQAYSQMWGLAATLVYIEMKGRWRLPLWLAFALIGTFAKENCITFFFIPQVLAWGTGKTTIRQALKDTAWALLVILAYFLARNTLTNDNVRINNAYFENTLSRKLKNLGVFIGMTWIPLDYICLWHAPNRNLVTVAVTLALGAPFMLYLFFSRPKNMATRRFLGLALAVLMAAAPHLVTLFSAMHPYAALGMAALMAGYLADRAANRKTLTALFIMFLADVAYIDWHHWQKSYESGLTGKRMANEAIRKMERPAVKLGIISIDKGETKYSSFCVIPRDAFGWGLAIKRETGYKWPEDIYPVTIKENETAKADSLTRVMAAEGFNKVILVHGDTVDVIR